jgi:hypothetical protein
VGTIDCEIPLDADVDAERVAEVTKRAEDEVFALLKANWPTVKRVANALCKHDRITTIELDKIIAAGSR